MHRFRHMSIAFFVLVLAGAPAFAQSDNLYDQVRQAYKDAKQYHATVDFAYEQRQGPWNIVQSTTLQTAIDREANKLFIDRPNLELAIQDNALRLRLEEVPDHYVKTDAPDPLNYTALKGATSHQGQMLMTDPPMFDVAFLLADDPVAELTNRFAHTAIEVEPDPDDPQQRPRLMFPMVDGDAHLYIDPQTKLITRAEIDKTSSLFGRHPDDRLVLTYAFDVKAHNEPIEAGVFELDIADAEAHESVTAMINVAFEVQAGEDAQGAEAANPQDLVGKDAPALKLATLEGGEFDLGESDARVVVLDFWASWCAPCRVGLPKIQAVADWAQQQDLPVEVYAVNVGETPEQAREYWDEAGLTMPVLMDSELSATEAYKAVGIPQTVLIADGRVRSVHVGAAPNDDLTGRLKDEIAALLAEREDAPQDEQAPVDGAAEQAEAAGQS